MDVVLLALGSKNAFTSSLSFLPFSSLPLPSPKGNLPLQNSSQFYFILPFYQKFLVFFRFRSHQYTLLLVLSKHNNNSITFSAVS